ncbi:MAG TPA: hypothetical protein VK609_06715 [Mucilaginibacter sp.]|nr:hypothetical protein [Mucilaginibacter sp.]
MNNEYFDVKDIHAYKIVAWSIPKKSCHNKSGAWPNDYTPDK